MKSNLASKLLTWTQRIAILDAIEIAYRDLGLETPTRSPSTTSISSSEMTGRKPQSHSLTATTFAQSLVKSAPTAKSCSSGRPKPNGSSARGRNRTSTLISLMRFTRMKVSHEIRNHHHRNGGHVRSPHGV